MASSLMTDDYHNNAGDDKRPKSGVLKMPICLESMSKTTKSAPHGAILSNMMLVLKIKFC